jgi:adenosylcobinamide kinase/adenosylcobinamide-phosphate guanylyltransferase
LPDAAKLTFVLGGARSGKSRHAEALVEACAPPWIYLATAQAFDDEMMVRIAQHRTRRSSTGGRTKSRRCCRVLTRQKAGSCRWIAPRLVTNVTIAIAMPKPKAGAGRCLQLDGRVVVQ